jgi:ABC-2 type transport system permease protein
MMTLLLWYGMWAFIAWNAYLIARSSEREFLAGALGRALLGVILYWQLSPMVSGSFGASLETRKLLAYPIPHARLFVIETLLRLTTAGEMLLVLAWGSVGLALNGAFAGPWSGARIAAAAVPLVAFNLLLAAGTRSIVERMLARRRVREIFVLGLVILVAMPRLLIASGVSLDRFAWILKGGGDGWLPWGAAARVMLGDGESAVVLLAWCAAGYLFGRAQFERSLRFDADAARATTARESERDSWIERMFRLPSAILPDPLAAGVEKELRVLSRTPRFRMVFMMGFTFGLIVWLPLVIGRRPHSELIAGDFLTLVSVYALALLGQVSYLNAFGFDRSAAQLYFVAPVPLANTVAAKNIATAAFTLLEVALVTGVSSLFVSIPPAKVLEAFLATAVSGLYLLAVGNVVSVNYPKASNPDRIGQSDPARRQGLIFLLFPLTLAPLLLAYVVRHLLSSDVAFYVSLAAAGSLGGAIYGMSVEAAARQAVRRRESLIEELSRSAGPIATD